MRWMRVLAGVVGVFAIVAIGIVVFVATLDLNAYKTDIEAVVEEATGRTLAIEGDIGLAWTPRPTLTTDTVRFANAPWGSRADMATIGRLEVAVEVLPLLSGTLDVQRVGLAGVDVLLERNADGVGNWAFIDKDTGEGPGAGAGSGPAPVPLLREVSLRDITVTWRPEPGGAAQTVQVATLDLSGEGPADPLDVTLEADLDGDAVTLNGTLPAVSEVLREGATLPVDVTGCLGGREIAFAANLRYRLGRDGALASVEAERLTLGLDGRTITGSTSVALDGARPMFRLALEADEIALPAAADGAEESEESESAALDAPLPFDLLTLADGDIDLALGRLTRGDLTLTDIAVRAVLRDGVLTLDRLDALLADGRIEASGLVDASGSTPRQSITATWRGADFGRLAQDLSGVDTFDGRGDAALDLAATGASVGDMLAGLGGTAWIVAEQGRISNADWELIAEDLTAKFLPFAEDTGRGALNCAVGRWTLTRGVAETRLLMVDSDRATVAGEGTIDLARERLDMRLVPKPKDTSLVSLATPILLSGALRDPEISLDPLAVAKGIGSMVGGAAVAGPFALLLPFVSAGSEEPACPEAIAIAQGRKAMPEGGAPDGGASNSGTSKSGAPGEQPNKPGGIKGLFDSLRRAVE